MCFGIRILSPFHLGTIQIPIQNQKCPKIAKNACVDMTMLPSGSVRQIHYFCRKIIKLGISVAKISTYALQGQTLEEINYIFDQFNAWRIPWKYCDNRKKQYCSRDLKCVTEYGSTWQHCHVSACVFSVFRACDGYLYCAQMELIPKLMWKSKIRPLEQI